MDSISLHPMDYMSLGAFPGCCLSCWSALYHLPSQAATVCVLAVFVLGLIGHTQPYASSLEQAIDFGSALCETALYVVLLR